MIKVKSFTFSPFSENTYVLQDDQNNALIIDPGTYSQKEKEELRDYILQNKFKPQAILLTHAHLDHIFGVAYLKRHFGLKVFMHPLEKPVLADFESRCVAWGIPGCEPFEIDGYFEEGEYIEFGDYKFDILHVPGHAPGHVAFVSPENKFVVSGDCLFYRSIGRTDLPLGDYDTLIRSIKEKLLTLPEDYTVYAGHMQPTIIRDEIKLNPFLQS